MAESSIQFLRGFSAQMQQFLQEQESCRPGPVNSGVRNMNELVKVKAQEIDGFEGYEDQIEGDDRQQGGGIIQGAVIKFTNDSVWVTRDGQELSPDLELIAVDLARVVQKWKDKVPVETRVLGPGEKFPDIEALNDATPRAEWTKDPNDKPRGPWQAQHIVYLLNPATMDKYSFPTGTTGGAICVRELVDKCRWMRRYRGGHVYPVVTLSDTFMNTKFGGRQRPHFLIKRWVSMGADEKMLPASESATLTESEKPGTDLLGTATAEKPPEPPPTQAGAQTVEPPTLAEELNDPIPSDEDGSKSGREALSSSGVVVVKRAKGRK
jgi:hypothetical protein